MKFVVLIILTLFFLKSASQPSGCLLAVQGSLQCQVCSSNLQLDDLGNCRLFTPIEGCFIYNSSSNASQCLNCSQGSLLSNGICLQMLANCLETTNVNTCDQCKGGYTLVRYSNCFSTNVTNCPLGTLPRTANAISFCQQFNVLNCAVLSADGQSCSNCSQGFTSINGVCFSVQNTVPCPSNSCNCQGYYFSNNCYATQLPNCLSTSDRIYCDLCNDLYYSSSGACTKFIKNSDINCNVLSSDGTTCAGCNLNYFLNPDFICSKNYQLCLNSPCTACPWNGFTLHNGNCYYQDPLCLVYNFISQSCSLCLEGYTIDPLSLNCVKQVTCLTRDANNFCNKCFTGYQLDFNTYQCVPLPNNCAIMNTSSLVCLNCTQATTFSNNICVFRTANCLTYNIFGYCQTCASNFVQIARSCIPIAANCEVYTPSDQSKCSECMDGYRLSGGQCFLSIEGCVVYSGQSACLSCNTTYLLANGNCYFNDPNCVSQDSNGLCQQCLNGYLPFKSRCVYYDPYCLAYDTKTMTCSQTSSAFSSGSFSLQQQLSYLNFVMQAGSFSQNAANADFNGANGQGSYTKDGKIISLPFAGISSQSIASYDLNGNILTCRPGFTRVNTQCVIATQNCMAYNQMNTCQQCNPGYDLMADSSCSFRSSASCARQAGGICIQAASGYSLIGGSAYFAGNNIKQMGANGQIVAANGGYFVWGANNIAWAYDFNCIQQNEPGKCLQCVSSQYTNVKGKCILNKLNCQVYSAYGLCMGCQNGFVLWAGQCRRANCNGFDPATGYCNACVANYVLSLGLCAPRQLTFCQMYNGATCSFCQMGYYLTSGGLCAKMINFCQSASAQTGRCSQCIHGYTIYQQQCIVQIANCQVYFSNLTSCSTCNTLYYPILNSTTCSYLGFYCAAMNDSGQCVTCNPGLSLTVQNQVNICIRPIPNCFSYDASIKCSRCNSGYVLQYNKCKSIRCGNFNFTSSQCNGCISPYVLTNGVCLDPNCAQNNLESCLSCLPRYYLNGGICILSPDPNCLTYSASGFCVKCLQSYTVNDKGICVSNDIIFYGCSSPSFPCPQCAVGYILNGSLCYARRCQTWKSNRDCQTCINYYQFQSTQRFCIIYTCAGPSCFQSDNAPAGFYNDASGSLRISNCVAYNGAACAQCDGYRFPNPSVVYNLCYPYNCQNQNLLSCGSKCNPNFAPTPSFPESCLAMNCLNWDSTGKCLKCQDKYQLTSSSSCLLIQIPFCLVINYSTASCSVCQVGFDLNNGYCRVSNCIAWQVSNNSLCTTCANGYQIDSNSNLCIVGKCGKYSDSNKSQCLQCLIGYSFQGPICKANNCDSYDWASMRCISCLQGYTLISEIGICQAANCKTFDSSLICIACINTTNAVYSLRFGVCVSVDINCISFDANGNCLACNNPTAYVNVADICIAVIQGCLQYNKAGCVGCLPAFSLSNRICQVLYCSNFVTPSKCSLCQPRYQLQSDFTCIPKNCLNFNTKTWSCSTCQPRFQLVNSQFCFTFNCSGYSVQNYICKQCLPGFTLSNQACLFVNCPVNNQLTCPGCVTGFQLIDGVCQGPRDNCVQYDPNNFVCVRCAPRYNLNALGICALVQIPDPYCVSYDPTSGICTKCLSNFNYNSQSQQCQSIYCSQYNSSQSSKGRVCIGCISGFNLDPSGKYCISIYCLSYSLGNGVCTSCQAGTSMSNNVCFALNCASYSIQYLASPICQQCNQGYSLGNSVCKANNCQTYNSDFTCQFCSSGFTLNNNGVCISTQCNIGFVFQNFNCVPANCLNYTLGFCSQCLPGFVQEKDSCVADSCMAFNNQFVCQQCRNGYNLTVINGQYLCVLINMPVCPRGYYLSSGSCISISLPNCSIVDSSGSNCLHCLDGYFLSNNICYSISGCKGLSYISGCYSCVIGFYLQGFICISLNCQGVYPNNTCVNCISGYSLVNGACKASIYKCLQSDNNGNCVQCMDNFQLNQGYCIAIGCASYSQSSYVCLSCLGNYYLSGEICLIKITIPNCYLALNATFCSQCQNSFVQLNGKCYPQIQFCVSYNPSNGACGICTAGYYLTNTFTCVILPPNCLSANSNGVCTNCAAGYIAASGQCVAGTANCKAFDPQTALCLTCNQGYYLTSNNRCNSLPQFCLAADRTGACTNCRGGYSISGGICVVTISYCMIYNQNNAAYCYQCIQGYYLNVRYTCTILPPFCNSANNLGYCLTCQQGYNLFSSNGICVIPVSNCISYVQAGVSTRCTQCASGFTLTNNFTCSSLPRNCLSVDGNGRCGQCVSGYQLYSNLCVIGASNCVSYDNVSYLCNSCVNGYFLFLNNAVYICQLLPRFCLSANPIGNCLTCINNYILYNQLCVLNDSIRNCQSYDLQSYVCLSCIQGYYLTANNICNLLPNNCLSANPNGACLNCAPRYQLRGTFCVLYIIGCDVFNQVTGSCTQCAQGYSLSKDLTTCNLVVYNCQVFNPNGLCLQCFVGYFLLNGYCYALPQGCSQLNSNQICIGCLSQYTLIQNLCILTIPNCALYNSNGCYQCISFYYLYNGACNSFPANCLSFDTGLLRCVSCASGFTLNPNTFICSKTVFINNCAAYNSNGQCINCISRYYLRQNSCWQYPAYCVNVDLVGNCLSCAFGSNLQNGLCVANAQRSLNCLTFNSTTSLCMVCMVGYNFCTVSGICILPDPGCLSLVGDGTCAQCKSSYQLFQGRCIQYPTGVIVVPNGGTSCASGYSLQNNSCYRTTSQLTKLSENSFNFLFAYSSNGLNSFPFIGSNTFWTPAQSQLNQYLSIQVSSGRPQIVFQIDIKGNGQGWVSGYVIQFKNRPDSPFICWNSCNMVMANSDGFRVSSLQMSHPLIATELRVYPVSWSTQIAMQLQLWIQSYQ